jgi:DnaJ-class molecular chaperone
VSQTTAAVWPYDPPPACPRCGGQGYGVNPNSLGGPTRVQCPACEGAGVVGPAADAPVVVEGRKPCPP